MKPSSLLPRTLFPTAPIFFMPRSAARLSIFPAVSMLRLPGSTTTTIMSTAFAVPLPRCSIPASMSITTTSSRKKTTCDTRLFNRALSGHTHPAPPFFTVPMTMRRTFPFSSQSFSGRSSTFGLIVKKEPDCPGLAPVLSSMSASISAIGTILSMPSKPRVAPRFASGSASIAMTRFPFSATCLMIRLAIVVLPTPPFPVTASFNRNLLCVYISLYRNYNRYKEYTYG